MTKFIFITGGVLSGIGKGVISASLGKLLKAKGLSVTSIKIDPYLNCDARNMAGSEHGEIFVLKDGTEVDQDFGNYERFLDTELTGENNITTGKVYKSVIEKERAGEYQGKTVQIIPHVTREIKERIWDVAGKNSPDVVLIEIGGTVGDIEGMPFLEAVRQLYHEVNEDEQNALLIHTTLVPVLDVVGEQKTKPTQHSAKALRDIGLEADVIVGRCEEKLESSTKKKISLFCEVPEEAVISSPDVNTVYKVPLILKEEGLRKQVIEMLSLQRVIDDKRRKDIKDNHKMKEWEDFIHRFENPKNEVEIGLLGNHGSFEDIYASHEEALNHCRARTGTKVNINYIDPTGCDRDEIIQYLDDLDGLIVPNGPDTEAVEGKLEALEYARKNSLPTLTMSHGFHLAVIEFARNVLGYNDAHSTMFDEDASHPVVDSISEKDVKLGAEMIDIKEGSMAEDIYDSCKVVERHKHTHEVNPEYVEKMGEDNLSFTARSSDEGVIEMLELEDHPFFVGCQFHPQFGSKPMNPAPLFLEFVRSVLEK